MPRETLNTTLRPKALRTFFTVLTAVVFLAAFSRRYWIDARDPYKCDILLNEGHWLDEPAVRPARRSFQKWQPPGCLLHEYKADDIAHCAGTRQMLFVGDSNVRQLFFAVAKKLNYNAALDASRQTDKHGNIQYHERGVDLRFVWDPFLNGSILNNELQIYQESISPTKAKKEDPAMMIVIGGGLWHARQYDVGAVRNFKAAIDNVINLTKRHDGSVRTYDSPFDGWEGIGDQVFLAPVEEPVYERLSPSRQLTIMPEEVDQMNGYLHELTPSDGVKIPWVNPIMTSKRKYAFEESGLHVVESIANRRADVILNFRCNAKVDNAVGAPYDRTCCSKYTSGNWFQWVLVAFGLFGLPAAVIYSAKLESATAIQIPKSLLTSVLAIGLALSYCFFADRSQLFSKVQKLYNHSEFLSLCGISLTIGLLTLRRSKDNLQRKNSNDLSAAPSQPFLSRDQTEEWKGWMQAIVLIYHWTGASKELWIYILVRLLVASYLFLTGYGHTMYFYERGDYSVRRVVHVLIRLNLLSVALSYQMYTNYLFYYFAPLISFWFLVVYGTLQFGQELNDNVSFLLGKIAISAATTALVHTQAQPLNYIFTVLRTMFGINWDANEWRFRVSLDAFIVYLGMLVALLNIWYRNVQSTPKHHREHRISTLMLQAFPFLRVAAVLASIVIIPGFWLLARNAPDKFDYNWWQPIISFLPILAFVVLRNCTTMLRSYYSAGFAWLGRCSLETITLQFHIWMAADTKGVLSIGIFKGNGSLRGDRWREFILLTPVFLWTSWQVSCATKEITKWFTEDKLEDELPVGISKRKESPAIDDVKYIPKISRGLIAGDVGMRFALLLLGLWILNLATG